MEYTRLIKLRMYGPDVRWVKDALYALGYLKVKPTHSYFYNDTFEAVKAFQRDNYDKYGKELEVDGIVGELTFGSIAAKLAPIGTFVSPLLYPNLSAYATGKINTAVAGVGPNRLAFVLEVLKYAYDDRAGVPGPTALYVFGADLYTKSLDLCIATEDLIRAKAKRNPQYFDDGRLDWMIARAKEKTRACSDCSGTIVGIFRKLRYISANTDATANGLCGSGYSKPISKSDLIPGDFVGKDGHIGIYVGGGFAVEFAGGVYGCQLTEIADRKCRNFMDGELDDLNEWTKFRRPKIFVV